jgi:hypothetical protein
MTAEAGIDKLKAAQRQLDGAIRLLLNGKTA